MDRVIVYPGALSSDQDILNTNRNTMVALGYACEAIIGTTTAINGLACTPTSPTSLNVVVGRGILFAMSVIDQNAYGSLPADTSDPLMKAGINTSSTTLAITPPTTSGYSQNYLIEAQLLEEGSGSTVLSYYNSTNPALPYSGPSNDGAAQNTSVIQRVSLQLKAGTPAPAGTQVTPGADSGWTPLYVVSVNNGQTHITSSNISRAPGSPFLLSQLSQLPHVCTSNLTLYVSSTNGNDVNTGLQPQNAFATLQAAVNAIINGYDLNGYTATISLGAGTFAGALIVGLATGQISQITIQGAGSGSTTIAGGTANGIDVRNAGSVFLSGMTITGNNCVALYNATANILSDVVLGDCTFAHIENMGGLLQITDSYSYTGTGACHYYGTNYGTIETLVATVAISCVGSAAFSTAFCYMVAGQFTVGNGTATFPNASSVTGSKYLVTGGGFINTNGGGANFFPGNSAGTGAGTTGYYA